jgi:Polyketide cyclase / dehydrase and lipid transport
VAESIKAGATASSRANPAAVFALLKNCNTWPRWSMFDSAVLERAGDDEPHGVGAIRVFSTRVSRAREQVTELIPNQRLSYVLLSGLPLRNYRAAVSLTPSGGGTLIDWTASFQCRHGTGWFWRIFMNHILSSLAMQLAAAAENPGSVSFRP